MERLIETAIYNALLSNSTISSTIGTRVFADLAPVSATFPLVLLAFSSGGDDNETDLESVDVLYAVQAIATAAESANTLAEAIRTALHRADLTISGGWNSVRCEVQSPIRYVEQVDRKQYWHRGYIVRVQASK